MTRDQLIAAQIAQATLTLGHQISEALYAPRVELGSIVRVGMIEYVVAEFDRKFLGLGALDPPPNEKPFKLKMLHTAHDRYLHAGEAECEITFP